MCLFATFEQNENLDFALERELILPFLKHAEMALPCTCYIECGCLLNYIPADCPDLSK